LRHKEGFLTEVLYKDSTSQPIDALYARVSFEQHSEIPSLLGCAVNEQGYIEVDMMQKTSVTNVLACGDNCSPIRSVANAVADVELAVAMANAEHSKVEFDS